MNEQDVSADLDAVAEQEPALEPPLGPELGPDALVGTRIDGRYRLDRVIGRGGMAVVYAGEHLELQNTVAIKVLDEVWATDADAVERFLLEARVASSLHHANIVSVSDLGRLLDGRPYLVMPMIAGEDLATLLMHEGPMPAHRVALMLKGVASALDLIHAKGLLHRDIKSENLMHVLHEDGTESVLVLDFGIASACLSRIGSKEGAWSGTPEFMPPEALMGRPPDQRADVYALATVAFELIAGRLPFDCEDLASMVREKTEVDPRTLSDASGAQFDPALEDVLAQGLARLPEQRYDSAGELIADLDAVSSPATAPPQPTVEGAVTSRRARTLVRGDGAGGGVTSALLAAQRAAALMRETEARTGVRRARGSGRPPAESGKRAIAGPGENRDQAKQDPWLYTWSLPKLDQGQTRRSSRPPPAIVDGTESDALASQPAISSAPPMDEEAAAAEARKRRRTQRALRGMGYATLGVAFLAGAMQLVTRLSDESARKESMRAAAVRVRTASDELAAAPPASPIEPALPTTAARPDPAKPSEEARADAPSPAAEVVEHATTTAPVLEPALAEHASSRDSARASRLTLEASRAFKKGDAQSALETIDRALQADARYALAWRGKGMILDGLGHTREAAEAYREFLKLRPSGEQADTIRKRLWQLSPR
jgi:serine/threonine-protein kinase